MLWASQAKASQAKPSARRCFIEQLLLQNRSTEVPQGIFVVFFTFENQPRVATENEIPSHPPTHPPTPKCNPTDGAVWLSPSLHIMNESISLVIMRGFGVNLQKCYSRARSALSLSLSQTQICNKCLRHYIYPTWIYRKY